MCYRYTSCSVKYIGTLSIRCCGNGPLSLISPLTSTPIASFCCSLIGWHIFKTCLSLLVWSKASPWRQWSSWRPSTTLPTSAVSWANFQWSKHSVYACIFPHTLPSHPPSQTSRLPHTTSPHILPSHPPSQALPPSHYIPSHLPLTSLTCTLHPLAPPIHLIPIYITVCMYVCRAGWYYWYCRYYRYLNHVDG